MVGRDHGASFKENMIPNATRGPGGPLRKSFQVEQNMMNEKQENKRNASPTCHPRVPSVQHAGAPFMGVLGNRGMDHGAPYRENMNHNTLRDVDGPLRRVEQNMGFYPSRTFQSHDYDLQNLPKSYSFQQVSNKPRGHYEGKRQQLCRFYPIGRCHYGTNCKYLH
ncbi:putative transcription factor C3H family [Helianthus debilis subsp. tardiflorus]